MNPGAGESESDFGVSELEAITESKGGSVSPSRVCRELAIIARIKGANTLAQVLDDTCGEINRESHRANSLRSRLWELLYALHARPLFGGPHLSVEDAIANANALLDGEAQ